MSCSSGDVRRSQRYVVGGPSHRLEGRRKEAAIAASALIALPVVISDTEAAYLYGLDILAQQQSERMYYAHDGLGSVRQGITVAGAAVAAE